MPGRILLEDSVCDSIKFNNSGKYHSSSKQKLHCLVILLKLSQRLFCMYFYSLLYEMHWWLCPSQWKVHHCMPCFLLRTKILTRRENMSLMSIQLQKMHFPQLLSWVLTPIHFNPKLMPQFMPWWFLSQQYHHST